MFCDFGISQVVFVPSPLSLSHSVPEDLKRKVTEGKFMHLYKLIPGYAEQEEGQF